MGRRSVRVVAIDASSGEARALGGTDHYVQPGFAASLNLAAADQSLHGRALHVAYDDGRVKALIPLECRIEGAP
jgi:hypothetical protein